MDSALRQALKDKKKHWVPYFKENETQWDKVSDDDLFYILTSNLSESSFLRIALHWDVFPDEVLFRMATIVYKELQKENDSLSTSSKEIYDFINYVIMKIELDEFLFDSFMNDKTSVSKTFNLRVSDEIVANYFRKTNNIDAMYHHNGELPQDLLPLIISMSEKDSYYRALLRDHDVIDSVIYQDMTELFFDFPVYDDDQEFLVGTPLRYFANNLLSSRNTPHNVLSNIVERTLSDDNISERVRSAVFSHILENPQGHIDLIAKFEGKGIQVPANARISLSVPIDSVWYSFGNRYVLLNYMNSRMLSREELDDVYDDGYIADIDLICAYILQRKADQESILQLVKNLNTNSIVNVIGRTADRLPTNIINYFYEKKLVTIDKALIRYAYPPEELVLSYIRKNTNEARNLLVNNDRITERCVNLLAIQNLNARQVSSLSENRNFGEIAYESMITNPHAHSILRNHKLIKNKAFMVEIARNHPSFIATFYRIDEDVVEAAFSSSFVNEKDKEGLTKIRENNRRYEKQYGKVRSLS